MVICVDKFPCRNEKQKRSSYDHIEVVAQDFYLALLLQVLLLTSAATYSQEAKEITSSKRNTATSRLVRFVLTWVEWPVMCHEYQHGFDVRRYEPGTHDHFHRANHARYQSQVRQDRHVFVQFRDAHALGTRLEREDFSKSNPFEDLWDIRQAYFEWKKIGGSHLDLKIGRQQISYGDQRIFGPGLWGNTGRYAWDAALLHLDTSRVWLDAWTGRPIQNRPELWPNREFKAPTAFVLYGRGKGLPCRLISLRCKI
jgi:hypothetical protein